MPAPVCVPCRLFYRPQKNGVTVEEGMPGQGYRPATDSSGWYPYKLWRADLWKCQGCGHEIVVGFAGGPLSEHYMPDYERWKESYPPIVFIPDCC